MDKPEEMTLKNWALTTIGLSALIVAWVVAKEGQEYEVTMAWVANLLFRSAYLAIPVLAAFSWWREWRRA